MRSTEHGTTPPARPAALRAGGSSVWRSLEDRDRSLEDRQRLQRELAAPLPDGYTRRNFLQFMGASMALAGLAGCGRQPLEKIVPYVKQPEELVPGKPLFFATALTLAGVASPVLVESHQGRPTKVEGNPEHPASRGATDRFAQAEIMRLYDPDRSTTVLHLDDIATWPNVVDALRVAIGAEQASHGAGFRVLTPIVTSPTLGAAIAAFLAQYPAAKWVQYEVDSRDAARDAARRLYRAPLGVRYDLREAAVIVTLDADVLTTGPGNVRYARDFMAARRIRDGGGAMNRLYTVESMPTGTGSVADHRLALPPSDIALFTAALAAELGVPWVVRPRAALDPKVKRWAAMLARDLAAHRGRAVVVPGDAMPSDVHVLAHGINDALGAMGRSVVLTDPIEVRPPACVAELAELTRDMSAGSVRTLVVLGVNPVYDAPADLDFAAAMQRVETCVHLGLHRDETANRCHWHIPATHELESWGDARAYDGSLIVQQPLIDPLYDGKCALDVMAVLLGQTGTPALDQVRAHWQASHPGADFERFWRRTVHDGFVAGSEYAHKPVPADGTAIADSAGRLAALAPVASFELALRLDPNVHDGRFANCGWLQELPKPLSKLTWDNAALMSPATASGLGVRNGDLEELQTEGGRATAAVWVLPGHADRCVTAHLGYGRTMAGRVGADAGFDAYPLRTTRETWAASLRPHKTDGHRTLVTTQEHDDTAKRDLVRHATLAEFAAHPHFAHEGAEAPGQELSLYPPVEYKGRQWGLAIDLGSCTGCNACVVACNSENNVPVVGRDQVRRGREMQWIRIDRYFEGDAEDPKLHHQPVMCQQCEKAPCEVVCPVGATSHSPEGLNDMAYNRCVGTKYCSNNCPYKVRRFNFYKYADVTTPVLKLMRNPDVTVRTRGVMEKCTYCVQRINHARIQAKNEQREVRDGEILTACQQVCPAEAIVFGNINDPNSKVAQLRQDPRTYALLAELNTQPRTTYMAKVRNPNPELEASS